MRVRKLAKSELYARNVFMGINQWALRVVRYSAGIVDWNRGVLELLDRKTRKILTCNGLFHPRANVAWLYLKRCEGARGLIPAKDCVLSECNGLWNYDGCMMEGNYDRRTKERNDTNWKENQLQTLWTVFRRNG